MGFSGLSRTFFFLYWALIFEVPCLNCFQFVEVTQNPLVVIIGHNSTDVKLQWEFDHVADDQFNSLFIFRYKDGQYDQTKVEMGRYFSSGFNKFNNTLYALNASGVSPRGFASFFIKNILFQNPNKDGSKFDPLDPGVTYAYRIIVTMENLTPSLRENIIKLQVKVLPESTSISISPNQTGFCRGSLVTITCSSYAKPPAKYSLYHKLVRDNSTSGVFSVTMNDTGKNNYTCEPYNMVGLGQNRSLELLVKAPPNIGGDCKVISNNMTNGAVIEGETVTLLCNDISGSEPLNISWTNGSRVWNQVNLTFDPVNRVNDGYYHMIVSNGKECNEAEGKNLTLTVYYLTVPDICKNPKLGLINKTHYGFNVNGYPNPNINCTTGHKPQQSYHSNANGFHNVSVSNETDCTIENEAGRCTFTLSKKTANGTINGTFIITNLKFESQKKDKLSNNLTLILQDIYNDQPWCENAIVVELLSGSVIVNFQLIVVGVSNDYLQPLKNAVKESSSKLRGLNIELDSIKYDFSIRPTTSPTTIKTTKPSTEVKTVTTEPTLPTTIIAIGVAVPVVLICIIVLIVCCWKKKRSDSKNSGLVDRDGVVEIPMNDEAGASDNHGFSPSQYAERGPPHIDPAYDSVDRVQKDAKDKNDNPTQSERETNESPYAAVDMTKKTKKKNSGELLYAELGDFQKNGDKAPGSRGGIVLEPLPKGQHTKMPDQYEETIYADIVGTKKPASDNQNAEGTSTDVPLDELHGQANETEKPSGENADPSKPNDQKPATGENENPTDVQSVKPLAKEDSADSLHMNGRNNTTLTTVSL